MGHLLSTTNPEAAARLQAEGDAGIKERPMIDPPNQPAPVALREPEPYAGYMPKVGEMVQYHARPGEGRAGKVMFPAIVMHVNERGLAQLVIVYAADDIADRVNIGIKSEEVPWPAWTPMSAVSADHAQSATERLDEAMRQIALLSAEIDDLKSRIISVESKRRTAAKATADED